MRANNKRPQPLQLPVFEALSKTHYNSRSILNFGLKFPQYILKVLYFQIKQKTIFLFFECKLPDYHLNCFESPRKKIFKDRKVRILIAATFLWLYRFPWHEKCQDEFPVNYYRYLQFGISIYKCVHQARFTRSGYQVPFYSIYIRWVE